MEANEEDLPLTGRRRAVREFTREGMRWTVREVDARGYDRRGGGALIFASDTAVRLVRDYPADWATRSDDDLLDLSWGR
jgi:hypothetical protein